MSGTATALLDIDFLERNTDSLQLKNIIVEKLATLGLNPSKYLRTIGVDSAAYAIKTVEDLQQLLHPHVRRDACLAHIWNLGGEDFQEPFEVLFLLLSNWKMYQEGSRARGIRWVSFMHGNNPTLKSVRPPFQNDTHWSSVFRMVRFFHCSSTPFVLAYVSRNLLLTKCFQTGCLASADWWRLCCCQVL